MHNKLKNLTLVLASTFLALACVEVILRIGDGLPLLPSENLILARADRFTRRGDSVHDAELGWLLRANLRAQRTRTEPSLTTGDFGIRMNQPEIRALPSGAILAVGDSFTFGAEVDDTSTWPAQLERTLGEPVLNGGVGGFGTDQIVLRALSLMGPLSPKTLLVSFLSSDVLRAQYSVYNGAAKPYFLVDEGKLVAMNQPVPPPSQRPARSLGFPRNLLGHSYLVTWVMARLGVAAWFAVERNERVPNNVSQVTCLLLDRLKHAADQRGVRVIFMMQWPGEVIVGLKERPSYTLDVLSCAVDLGIQTIDSWDLLQAVHARGKNFLNEAFHHRGDGAIYLHMSRAGNAMMADLAAQAIRQPEFVAVPPRSVRRPAPRLDLAVLGNDATVQNLRVTRDVSAAPAGAATQLEDQPSPHGSIYQDIAIEDDDHTHSFTLDVRAGSSASAQILLAYLGGEQRVYVARVDTASMALSGDGAISGAPLGDGWWRITLAGANNRKGNRTVRVQVYPSMDDGGPTGSLLIANPRLDP